MDTWRDVVRDGYDSVSWAYRGDRDAPINYRKWTDELLERLPARGAAVLDLGCGCGVPLARDVVEAGHSVTGVDISAVQIDRARELVPAATFISGDLATIEFPPSSFDAVVCLYALIHLPDPEQHRTVQAVGHWLRPGGTFLATVGADSAAGTDPDWLGTGTTMWWSHPAPDTVRQWIGDAGMTIEQDRFVPEGSTGHQLILAARSAEEDRTG